MFDRLKHPIFCSPSWRPTMLCSVWAPCRVLIPAPNHWLFCFSVVLCTASNILSCSQGLSQPTPYRVLLPAPRHSLYPAPRYVPLLALYHRRTTQKDYQLNYGTGTVPHATTSWVRCPSASPNSSSPVPTVGTSCWVRRRANITAFRVRKRWRRPCRRCTALPQQRNRYYMKAQHRS